MAILASNVGFSVEQGDTAELTLNRTDLAAAISDPYYSDPTVIKKVVMVYRNSNQSKVLTFNEGDDVESVSFSAVVRTGSFVLSTIVLVDFDKGSYTLSSSEMTAVGSGFNFTVSEPV